MFLGPSFPAFRHFDLLTGTATSVVTIDTTAAAYRTASGLVGRLKVGADDLNRFTCAVAENGLLVTRAMVRLKVMEVAIPDVSLIRAQREGLDQAKMYATSRGVKMTVTVVT